MNVTLVHRFRFEAAHHLPKLPADHKCRRVHGHGYQIEVRVEGPIDPELGWYIDFADVARAADPLRAALDHRLLNDIEGLENPTAELLCVWLWDRLAPTLDGLTCVSVEETCTARCEYRGGRDVPPQ